MDRGRVNPWKWQWANIWMICSVCLCACMCEYVHASVCVCACTMHIFVHICVHVCVFIHMGLLWGAGSGFGGKQQAGSPMSAALITTACRSDAPTPKWLSATCQRLRHGENIYRKIKTNGAEKTAVEIKVSSPRALTLASKRLLFSSTVSILPEGSGAASVGNVEFTEAYVWRSWCVCVCVCLYETQRERERVKERERERERERKRDHQCLIHLSLSSSDARWHIS